MTPSASPSPCQTVPGGGEPCQPRPLVPVALPPLISSQPEPFWLTADLLSQAQRCDRRAYLNTWGDRAQADPPSDYLEKLKQDSAEHRAAVLQDYDPCHCPTYPPGDWIAGAQATVALMAAGVETIQRGVLLAALGPNTYGVSQPDLLIKQSGWSLWGDWCYGPIEVKLGKKPKLDYQLVGTYHAYLLAQMQGTWPPTSWLALREGRYYAIDLPQQWPKLLQRLQACWESLQAPEPPEVFIAHSRCDLCQWYSHCYGVATASQHLSLLPGVTAARYGHLRQQGLTSVVALAAAYPHQLAHLPGFGQTVAQKLITQAQATLENRAIARTQGDRPFLLTPQDLPSAPVELYFDIESAPDLELIYLHGVLVVDHAAQRETFHALVAETPGQEAQAWQQFLDLVMAYPTAPIYHFCPYEAQTVRKLCQQYGPLGERELGQLLDRFVDIHWAVTEAVILPIESYALKPMARWVGFEWRDPEANGAQSICWYEEWMATGNRAALEAILRYNEDDCWATYRVKQWLGEFAAAFWAGEGVCPTIRAQEGAC